MECRAAERAIESLVRDGRTLEEARQLVCAAAARVLSRRRAAGVGWGGEQTPARAAGAGQAEIPFSSLEEPTSQTGALQKIKAASEIAPIKAVREAVSPWLWVTSLVGFGMALLNTRRIAAMYQGWRAKRRTA